MSSVPLLTLSHAEAQYYFGPYRRTFAEFIVEPTDVLTMDIHILMEDIILTPMGDIIIPTPTEDITFRPISGDGAITNAIGAVPWYEQVMGAQT
jgi:hypothetical protein